jgi:hypothetical protein
MERLGCANRAPSGRAGKRANIARWISKGQTSPRGGSGLVRPLPCCGILSSPNEGLGRLSREPLRLKPVLAWATASLVLPAFAEPSSPYGEEAVRLPTSAVRSTSSQREERRSSERIRSRSLSRSTPRKGNHSRLSHVPGKKGPSESVPRRSIDVPLCSVRSRSGIPRWCGSPLPRSGVARLLTPSRPSDQDRTGCHAGGTRLGWPWPSSRAPDGNGHHRSHL